MREGQKLGSCATKKDRITPACAGRTVQLLNKNFINQDHPRVCGKDIIAKPNQCFFEGSPPRVREGRKDIYFLNQSMRITPACAGRTNALIFHGSLSHGSPPRVREGPSSVNLFRQYLRITPACAGRTL